MNRRGQRREVVHRHEPAEIAGRAPPHDESAEAAVLSAVLLERDALDRVLEILRPEHFYKLANQRIYEAAVELATVGGTVDIITIAGWLRDRERMEQVGGPSYLAQLADATPAVAHVAAHAQVVYEKWRVRQLIATCQRIAAEGYGDVGVVQQFIDSAEQAVYQLAHDGKRASETQPLSHALRGAFEAINNAVLQGKRMSGTPTGYEQLDAKTAGLHDGEVVIVAARPSMGKTAFALNIAVNVASPRTITVDGDSQWEKREVQIPGEGVAIFSLEMPKEQLATRMACSEGRVDLGRVRQGMLQAEDWRRLTEAASYLSALPIWLDDSAVLGILELRAKIRRIQAEYNRPATETSPGRRLGLVVVDYIGLMHGPGESREQVVSGISRGLKRLAGELKVPVMALSQLNRAVETRTTKDKRPQLSDLRECLTGDTVVLDAVTGRSVTVQDIARGQAATVYGLHEQTYRVVSAPVTRAWSTGNKLVFRLRTKTGRTVRATANHPLRTIDGWSPLEQIRVGDRIAVPRQLPEPTAPINALTADELRLLGYLISDGHYAVHRSVGYVKADRDLVNDVRRIAAERFGVVAKDHRCKGIAEQIELTVNGCGPGGNPVIQWLKKLGVHGELGHQKRVPESVFQCDNEHLGIFLGALWSGDGTVTRGRKKGWSLKFPSTSMGLLADVHRALCRLGVIAALGPPGRNSKSTMDIATVSITDGDAILRFAETVQLRGEKARKLALACDFARSRRENARIDRMPLAVTTQVRAAAAAQGVSWAMLGYRCQGKEISRGRLCRVGERLGRHDFVALATSDVLWDEVRSIEPDGVAEVFDVCVPGTHNFVANGVFVHNSGAIEQDADCVLFLYRDEAYFPDTTNQRGIAEVIVAKQRNGPTGKVLTRFSAACTRFDNLARDEYPDMVDD